MRNGLIGTIAILAIILGGALCSVAAQDASSVYKGTARDPFEKRKPIVKPPKSVKREMPPAPVEPPAIQVRIDHYKALKLAAMRAQLPAPKPTTALLLSEFQVIGIFRTPRGYAAMVEATPINLSYVIYPGEVFYDGQLVAIEENRLVFRHETRFTNGRSQMAVEMKPLRQPNPVEDSMASNKTSAANASSPAAAKDKQENRAATGGN